MNRLTMHLTCCAEPAGMPRSEKQSSNGRRLLLMTRSKMTRPQGSGTGGASPTATGRWSGTETCRARPVRSYSSIQRSPARVVVNSRTAKPSTSRTAVLASLRTRVSKLRSAARRLEHPVQPERTGSATQTGPYPGNLVRRRVANNQQPSRKSQRPQADIG